MNKQPALLQSLVRLLAAVILWPTLCAFSWAFLSFPAAFVCSVLVSWAMVLITWPAVRFLCLPKQSQRKTAVHFLAADAGAGAHNLKNN
tara:strand:+ start:78 stop:344 length:267 start_codon:yes stop_codon:yes gene_type:complete